MREFTESELYLKRITEKVRKERGLILKGECKRCGKCCDGPAKVYLIKDEEITFERFNIEKSCEGFDKKKRLCKIHDKDKPLVCVLYPFIPEVLFENCGFWFENINDALALI
jgi:Fe-S-cluster containining protein